MGKRTTQGVVLFFFELLTTDMETHKNSCTCEAQKSYELKLPYLPFTPKHFDTLAENIEAAKEIYECTQEDTELWENCSCGKTTLLHTYR